MTSGIGFQSSSDEKDKAKARNRKASKGIIVAGFVLLIVIATWFVLKMQKEEAEKKVETLKTQISEKTLEIDKALPEDVRDVAARSYALEDKIYNKYTINDVLKEIEDKLIHKKSTNERVVLKSFSYKMNDKKIGGKKADEAYASVAISADADSFNVMAQQIDVFKKSEYFSGVHISETDRDDSGRIIFSLTLDLAEVESYPFEDKNKEQKENENVEAVKENKEVKRDEGTSVVVEGDNVSVTTDDSTVSIESNGEGDAGDNVSVTTSDSTVDVTSDEVVVEAENTEPK